VSGNVSFYNETDGRPIPPTPTIAMVGLLTDIAHHTTQWFKSDGDVVLLLGRTREELGGSEYLAIERDIVRGTPPWIDLSVEMQVQRVCLTAIREGIVRSATTCRRAASRWRSPKPACPGRASRSAPRSRWRRRFVRTRGCSARASRASSCPCARSTLAACASSRATADVPCAVLGEVRGRRLRIGTLIDVSTADLRHVWADALAERMGG
jgi:phosphoribosylformylglycinamidine synthase